MTSVSNPTRVSFVVLMLGMTAGCAKEPQVQVHGESAVAHEQEATAEEAAAEAEEALYDPKATGAHGSCEVSKNVVCWSDRVNPTEEHEKRAKELRELAEKHRAAAAQLKEVEAKECAGIDDRDRDMSPFSHVEDIRSVAPVHEKEGPVKSETTRLVGADITFAAVPGLTQQWFQRLVDCHIARAEAQGVDAEDVADSPLHVKGGVKANVSSTQDGFQVRVLALDPHSAPEVLERAQLLVNEASPE